MVNADNGAIGLEITLIGKNVHFTGHFTKDISSEIILRANDAVELVSTGTYEIHGQGGGLISHMPQGVCLFFKPNRNNDLICVGSKDFKSELRRALSN